MTTTFRTYEELPEDARRTMDQAEDKRGEVNAVKAKRALEKLGYTVETDHFCWIIEGITKALCLLAVSCSLGCSTPRIYYRYHVPAHDVIICDKVTLREIYSEKPIRGRCYPYRTPPEIYCLPNVNKKDEPSPDIYWHEVKHLLPQWGMFYHR